MCGIAGFSTFMGSIETSIYLHKMLVSMLHRGPDSQGSYADEYVALGATRLNIVDAQNGTQPFKNETGRVVAVYNGEIYNSAFLREILQAKGHVFRSMCDGEVITHLYEEFGSSFLGYLDGMFALALWDNALQKLIVACDHSGIKPLYFMKLPHNKGIAFASEIKALKCLVSQPFDIDPVSVIEYFRYKAIPPPHTIYKEIFKLSPAEAIIWDNNGFHQYSFKINESIINSGPNLSSVLVDQIVSTTLGDVEISCTLSGGLDSSYIAKVLADNTSHPLQVYSVGYPGFMPDDESGFARRIAESLGALFCRVEVDPNEIPYMVSKIAWHLDEPHQNPVCIPFFVLMRHIGKRLRVVLTGDGADEIFAGYQRYGNWDNTSLPQSFLRYREDLILFSDGDLRCMLTNNRQEWMHVLREADNNLAQVDNLRTAMMWELKYRQPSYHLSRVDKLSMAWSVEARVPYLRPSIISAAQAFAVGELRKNGTEKFALRTAAQAYLPSWLIQRQKKTFKVPIGSWIFNQLQDFVRDELFDKQSPISDWVNTQFISNLFKDQTGSNERVNRQIWALLMFQMFLKVDQTARS